MRAWADRHLSNVSSDSYPRLNCIQKSPKILDDKLELRNALLDFIADFSAWENSTSTAYLETSNALTRSAHLALGRSATAKPLVVDPFAGGGAMALEAIRVGANAFSSDLNPVAITIQKVVLRYIPRYGVELAEEMTRWLNWAKPKAEKELASAYSSMSSEGRPIAYLWARTVLSEAPRDD